MQFFAFAALAVFLFSTEDESLTTASRTGGELVRELVQVSAPNERMIMLFLSKSIIPCSLSQQRKPREGLQVGAGTQGNSQVHAFEDMKETRIRPLNHAHNFTRAYPAVIGYSRNNINLSNTHSLVHSLKPSRAHSPTNLLLTTQ